MRKENNGIVEIDLIKLLKNNLNVNEYLTLIKINGEINDKEFPFTSTELTLKSLEEKEWLILEDNEIELSKKAYKLIGEKTINENTTTESNFDELFDIYPYRTPSGRILRSRNKIVSGKLTHNYCKLRDRYLRKVKTIDEHTEVLINTKTMISNANMRNSIEYLQQLETYINQNSWENYTEGKEDFSSSNNIIRL